LIGGRYFHNGTKGASRDRIRVGEDSPVGWSLLGTRPRSEIHSICILVEAEVQGKMKVQDTLEVTIQAFSPTSLPPGQLSHDHTETILTA